MVEYKKENGFPIDLNVVTEEYYDVDTDWKGFKSTMTESSGNVIKILYHTEHRARVHWVDGYMTALTNKANEKA